MPRNTSAYHRAKCGRAGLPHVRDVCCGGLPIQPSRTTLCWRCSRHFPRSHRTWWVGVWLHCRAACSLPMTPPPPWTASSSFTSFNSSGTLGAGVAPGSPDTFPWLSPGCHPPGISTFMASSRLCTDTNRPTVGCARSVSWHECFRTRSACGSVCLCMTSPHGVASSQVLPTVACRLLEPSAQYVPCLPVGHSQSAPVCYD